MIDIHDYSAKYAGQYDGRSFETTLVEIRRRHVLAAMRAHPHRRVLEVGCGLEPLFPHADGYDAYTVVEPVPEFADAARALAAGLPGVRVLTAYLEDAGAALPGAPFDFVAVSSLLHEVPDPARLLASVRALCGADTVAHFNVPNVGSFHRLLALEMGLIESVFEPSEMERRFGRHTRYDAPALAATVGAAGFEVLRAGTYFVKPFTHAQMQQMLDARVIDAAVVRGLEAMTKHLPGMGCEAFVDVRRR